jgi:PAS domain S-box-containing protein
MAERIAVSSADFIRNIGRWQQEALQHPIVITHHGRERLVLAAPERFRLDAANDCANDDGSIRELRAAHAAMLSHMEEGCLTFAPDDAILSANAVAAEFVGLSEEELKGRQLTGVLTDLLSLIIMDRVARVRRTRSSEQFEADAADGRHLRFHVFPSAGCVSLLFHNATETVRLQRELEEGRGLMSAAHRNAGAAVLRLDPRGRLDAVDEVFCSWTGFNAPDLVGHRLAELVVGQERREVGLFIERVLGAGTSDQVNMELLGRTGAVTPCLVTMAPIVSDFVPRGVIALVIKAA